MLAHLPEGFLQLLRGWHYRRTLRSFTDAEEPDLMVMRELVQPGATVVDLGANMGLYTKVLAELVGPAGTVISVEPIPQTFAILARNVDALKMSNVICRNVAISDFEGEVVMELPNFATGGINFYQAAVVASPPKTGAPSERFVHVPSLTLDALVRDRGTIDFVKCDVEGHELACLAGAEVVLNSHFPAWLIEVWGDPDESGSSARKLFRIFEGLSYTSWWFDGHQLVKRRTGDRSTNYFFLKDSHVARLGERASHLLAV
jgi:FkbM family methyltransferase